MFWCSLLYALFFSSLFFQQDLDTRIIIGSFSYVIAAKIFCEVIIKHENFNKNERRKGRKIRRNKTFLFSWFFLLALFSCSSQKNQFSVVIRLLSWVRYNLKLLIFVIKKLDTKQGCETDQVILSVPHFWYQDIKNETRNRRSSTA